jgi:hypothetical protein
MKRAIPFLLSLAATAACSSSGSTPGSAFVVLEPSQSPPSDPQEALFNPSGPPVNSDQAPLNPDQPPFATSPAAQGFDACPLLCGHIDARCAGRCADTCSIYNIIAGVCGGEIAALLICVGNNGGLSCNDNGRLRLEQGLCTAEATAALPCVERFSESNSSTPPPTSNPAPGPTGITTPPPQTFDAGSSTGPAPAFDGGR